MPAPTAARKRRPAPDQIAPSRTRPRQRQAEASRKAEAWALGAQDHRDDPAAAGAIAAGCYGYHWWTVGRFMISTDDAYINADIATLSAKVSGYVTAVDVCR